MSTNGSSKTQRQKYDLQQFLSLSPMQYRWVSVCLKYRVSLSIYTSFWLDNHLPGSNSVGDSNNPSAPQLWGLCPSINKGGLTSMNLHYLITLLILPIGTLKTNEIEYMKYTSEYILKLQIHEHSLLTRKLFSWYNSSTQVFFFG